MRTASAWLFYGLLLGVSFVVRHRRQPSVPVDPLERVAHVLTVEGVRLTSPPIRMAYREYGPDRGGEHATVLLLHGSPGRKEEFERLAPVLAHNARVVVPDLPGFGSSTRRLPDYSFCAHAVYVRQLLDYLGVRRAHVLGYSMGGGVALCLLAVAPERVASLTMVSAIGVQEMELTGDYYVNHAVHGAQLAALWAMREGTPHMGLLDDAMLGVPYARNFFDSDQRPLRAILRRISVPTLIVHGIDDPQVPIDVAREHHRLVPQCELLALAGDHFLVFTKATSLGRLIGEFVDRVAEGRAPARADADPERVRAAALPFDPMRLPRVRGIAAVAFGGVLAIGALLSESIASVAAGMFVARGRVSLGLAMTACLAGVFLAGALSSFRGDAVRRPTLAVLGVASAVRTVAFVGAGVVASWLLFRIPLIAAMTPYVRATLVIAVVTGVLKLGLATATHKRRRLLVSTWRRLTRWEFWPPWMFYPPVCAYLIYLMLKHRSMTLFTAANPAILAGGVVGESKFAILQGLSGAGEYVARSCLIDGDLTGAEKVLAARRFMLDQQLRCPIVVKPNQGQRGSGVVVARTTEALQDALHQSSVDTIVQEYVGGAEFGVFYYRRPSEPRGHILSVTEKRFPMVVGDGRRTLEQLILDDERAVCSARLYLERHREHLTTLPAEGVSIALAELGTHCRGALFLDGGWVLSPALEHRFESIARGFDGFYFGRFDVRVNGGIDAFQSGRGFKVIELNGVTSEATHIYHPGTPLMTAYRVLKQQWRIAFEIGAENQRRGIAATSVRRLIQLASEYARASRCHLGEHRIGRDAHPHC